MKITHYTGSLSRSAGGLYFSVSGLAKSQLALGHDVSVVGVADQFFESDRHQWGDVPLRPTRPLSSYGFSLAPMVELITRRPDVFHIHGIWNAGPLFGLLAARLGCSVVVSPRGMVDEWILSRGSSAKRVHSRLFETPLFRKAAIHALNASEAASVETVAQGRQGGIFTIPNGIDVPSAPPAGQRSRSVLFLGRLHPKKQVEELIQAWTKLEVAHEYTLKIAGWGDDKYVTRLDALAQTASNVQMLGPLYGQAKDSALRDATYFILPSLSEGLPMAVLEALAAGAIPIITDECNLPELFQKGVAEHMRSDFSDFAARMPAILSRSEPELSAMSQAAWNESRRYDWQNIGRKMVERYHDRGVQNSDEVHQSPL